MSCHQSGDPVTQFGLRFHAYDQGWTPSIFTNGRQTLIDAVTQLEANKKDVTPKFEELGAELQKRWDAHEAKAAEKKLAALPAAFHVQPALERLMARLHGRPDFLAVQAMVRRVQIVARDERAHVRTLAALLVAGGASAQQIVVPFGG